MLDNEPDTHETTPTEQPAPAKAPRRRRAASRPAGPPAASTEAPATEPPVAEAPVAETPVAAEPVTAESPAEAPATESQPVLDEALPAKKTARKAATKRPARKTTAKTAAAAPEPETVPEATPLAEPAPEAPAEAAAEAPAEAPVRRTRAPRKRAAKKVAAPAAEQSADDLVAEAVLPDTTVEVHADEPVAEVTAPAEQPSLPEPALEAPAVTEAPEADDAETSDTDSSDAPAAAWAGEEAVAEVPAEALQRLSDAIAADHAPRDEAEQALEETPVPDLAPLEDSPLDVFDRAEGDREVQTEVTGEAASPTATVGVAPAAIDFSATAEPPQAETAGPAPEGEAESEDGDEDDSDEAESRDGDGDGSRRRRRRRGGRRRRRTGGDDDAEDTDSDSADGASGETAPAVERPVADAAEDTGSDDDDSADDPEGEGDGSRRRRRRRRRRGEDTGAAADDPGEVVVRVREPRKNTRSASSEVTGIEGSTRMEAKRQRRRDGREAGRRRAPILSEAEFLARRESVSRKMIVRQGDDLSQIAVIEDDILVEHYVDRDSAASLIGNVYLGRVQNVLPSMEAAFIDIGRGRNAVLYAGEVDWDSFGAEGQGRKVERVLKSGQTILVQVTKDPVGAKGARLTNHVSIPGRYIVYAPSGHLSGISRKLPDTERRRLKEILADLIGEASVIVRTAAEGASEEELVRDVNRLKAQWADIEKKVSGGQSPQLLYGEPDLTVRIVRDLFTEDFSELIIQGNGQANDAYDAVEGYVTHVAPHLADRLRRWDADAQGDLFGEFRLDEQIAKGLERKVFLPSGGSLVIDRTEAMTVIDVNTGKFTGSGGNLEATVTSNNLEAAEEIVNQLRLRDIGGIIVIDFIDMVLPNNRELLLRRLVECLGRDRTRHQVAEVTSLGLVQMTRKKIGTGLAEAFTTECPHCHGRGVEIHDLPVESQRQADGGARESGRRDNRRGGSGGNGGGGGNGQSAPKPPVPVEPRRDREREPEVSTPVEPEPATAEPVTSEAASSVPMPTEPAAVEAPAETGERTPRRRGGTRRRATREQGAPAVTAADPQAAPAADPEGEPVPSS